MIYKIKQIFLLFISLTLLPFWSLSIGENQKAISDSKCRIILNRMSQKLSANKTLKARFQQERHLVFFDDMLKSWGFFYYQKPGRIRWEYVEPYTSIIVMLETGKMEKFDVVAGRVIRVESDTRQVLSGVLTQILNWLQGDFAKVTEDFRIRMYQEEKYRLVLHPRSKTLASFLLRLEFEIDSKSFLVHKITLLEDEDDFTVIRFFKQRINEPLSDELFDLDKPKFINNIEK